MDIVYKFNFPPPRSIEFFTNIYLRTFPRYIHDTYILSKFLSKKKETKRKKKRRRRRRSIRRVEIPYTKDILRGRKNDEQRDRAFSMARSPDQRLSNDRPTRYHPAAHYDRRDRGVPPASKGPVFRAVHDRFAERWAQKKVRASDTQGEEGPRRVLEKRGRGEKCRK